MISEGSCDTEDWSNDAENSALIIVINYILKYIMKEKCYFKYFTILLFLLYIFHQTNAALKNTRDIFQKA